MIIKLGIILLLGLNLTSLFAENRAELRSLSVLPTTDTTPWKLGEALQNAGAKLFKSTQLFNVSLSNTALSGFTQKNITATFYNTQTELMGFTYLETSRVSIFLFDARQPGSFIVSSQSLQSKTEPVTTTLLEQKFQEAFVTLEKNYLEGRFQPLPEANEETNPSASGSKNSLAKANQMRKLYREMSSLEDKPFFMGANIGMSRYTTTLEAASSVDFGFVLGLHKDKWSAGLGIDIFSYALLHFDLGYRLPFAEKYVKVYISASAADVMMNFTENRGYNNSTMKTGSILVGPALTFDIPLLGADLRGEIRYYLGSSTVFIGTYGIIFSI